MEAYIVAYGIEADYTAFTDFVGQTYFEGLRAGMYLAVTEPVSQDGYKYLFDSVLVALPNLDNNGFWQYNVSSTPKSRFIPPAETEKEIELNVIKLWRGDSSRSERPESIEVEIFCDGTSYQTVTLSDENHWTYSWTVKDNGSKWKVAERNVPSGYTVTVEERGTTFVLTNTFIIGDPDTPPQTGDTSNILLYVILMNVSGIVLVLWGITGKKKRYEK